MTPLYARRKATSLREQGIGILFSFGTGVRRQKLSYAYSTAIDALSLLGKTTAATLPSAYITA